MAKKVTGEMYYDLDGQLAEIKRQLRQREGYPYDLEDLRDHLQEAIEGKFNSVRQWRERDGVIYFSVTSDGTTGEGWISRLENKGFQVSDWAKSILRSPDFKPTSVTTEIVVFKGRLFSDSNRTTKNIRAEAERRNLAKPNAETACLIREKFSDKEIESMELWWIVTMHDPIKDSDGDSYLLRVGRYDRWLRVCDGSPVYGWDHDFGFAFVVPQVS
ncbi:hypothetical protein KJ750_00805 [Patescibacteria group bacterium]|nr:hypothetical protein [Patescibacteria group bacterium]